MLKLCRVRRRTVHMAYTLAQLLPYPLLPPLWSHHPLRLLHLLGYPARYVGFVGKEDICGPSVLSERLLDVQVVVLLAIE